MKVLLLNGSPHPDGCIFTSLSEVGGALKRNGIDSEIFWIGNRPVQGCVACWKCRETGNGCVFKDKLYTELVEKLRESDGLVIGAPVYYAGPPGALCAILDRVFFSASEYLEYKPAACVVNCRRGGASASYDRLLKYFGINSMPIVTSQYWNQVHGNRPEEVLKDEEGLQTMRTLAENLAWLLKCIEAGRNAGVAKPEYEAPLRTNFIR